MKKNKKLVILFLFISFIGFSQNSNSNLGVQLGLGGSTEGAKFKVPTFFGSYENMISENIGIGGIVGYVSTAIDSWDWERVGGATEEKSNAIYIGGLANYYFVNDEKFKIYTGLKTGYGSDLAGSFFISFNVGGKYYIAPKTALNAELGFGTTLFKLGLNFDL